MGHARVLRCDVLVPGVPGQRSARMCLLMCYMVGLAMVRSSRRGHKATAVNRRVMPLQVLVCHLFSIQYQVSKQLHQLLQCLGHHILAITWCKVPLPVIVPQGMLPGADAMLTIAALRRTVR